MLRRGVYYAGNIWVPRSETEEAPIVIGAYPGEVPILDGSEPRALELDWKSEGNSIYSAAIDERLNDIYLLVVNGERRILRYGGKLADPNPKHTAAAPKLFFSDARRIDSFYIDRARNRLYVNLYGVDPRKVRLTVSRHSSAFIVQDVSFV